MDSGSPNLNITDAPEMAGETSTSSSSKSSGHITFYIDIISPFGYIAYYILRHSPVFTNANISLTYTPIVLGGLHKQCGNTAPILIKNKDKWINRERERWASLFKIPIRDGAPPGFPVSTINSGRALVALKKELELGEGDEGKGKGREMYGKVIELFWAALWAPDQVKELVTGDRKVVEGLRDENGDFDIKDAKVLEGLMGSVVGEEVAKRVIGRIGEKEVKDQLVKNTGEAFEKGAFGMPWFQCTNGKGETEGFWGFDHLGQVIRFLGLNEDGDRERSGRPMRALL